VSVTVRPAVVEDLPFLREMLYEAAAPEPGEPDPGIDGVLADPVVGSYLDGWGRESDLGVVAEADGVPVGAAWCRLPGAVHGFGYVADDTPELAIAVVEGSRGRGVGRWLMEALVAAASERGSPALSLSVMPTDPVAVRLYTGAGFERVGTNGDLWVMRRDLRGAASG
jgi:ribosomal protein S18 acetylase RimI-like enzyme